MSELIYKKNDKPDFLTILTISISHVLSMFAGIVTVPLIVAYAINLDKLATINLINIALIMSGISTILQVVKVKKIGSGYLSLMGSSGAFIYPSIIAGKYGGINLVFGALLIFSIFEILFAKLILTSKKIISSYISGIIIILLALSLIPIFIDQALGSKNASDFGDLKYLFITAITVIVILIFANVKNYFLNAISIIIGIIVGYIISYFFNLIDFNVLLQKNFFEFPHFSFSFSFSFNFLVIFMFLIANLISAFDTIGTMTMLKSIEDDEIKENDPDINGAVYADSLCSMLCGIFGTVGNTTFSGNASIVKITKVSSRIVGVYIGIILIILGFFPKIAAIISIMPHPVTAAIMFIAISIMFGMGIKLLNMNDFSNEKLFNIGIPIIIMISMQYNNDLYINISSKFKMFFNKESSLIYSAIIAIIFNIIINIKNKNS
jgi:NCS2 family nucleobase:cation symporter-2